MAYQIKEILDISLLQDLQERLNKVYSFPSAIIDNEGNVLTKVAWQDVCVKFHRKHPECRKECIKSDQYILNHLDEADPSVIYQCPHGLVDSATPIFIEGKHLGSFFTGQFFLEEPDPDFFRAQAARFGFEEKAYMEAVSEVPVWTREKLESHLDFIMGFIEVIAGLGHNKLEGIRTRNQIDEQEKRLTAYIQQSPLAVIEWDKHANIARWTGAAEKLFGWTATEMVGKNLAQSGIIHEEDLPIARAIIKELVDGGESENVNTCRVKAKSGRLLTCEWYHTASRNEDGSLESVLSQGQDITRRVKASQELEVTKESFADLNEFAIRLSSSSPGEHLERMIAEEARALTGAVAVTYSSYDMEKRVLTPRFVATEKSLLRAAIRILGRKIEEIESEISDDQYAMMTAKLIGFTNSFRSATFGAIPERVSTRLKTLLRVDHFIALAYMVEDRLYGTSLIAMKKGEPDPPIEILSSFRVLASVSLRRNQAEKERMNLQESLELLNERFIDITEKERAEVSKELHFQMVQSLTAFIMELKWIQKKTGENQEIATKLEEMLAQLSEMSRRIQVISSSLRPAMLIEIGLSATMEWYCNEFQSKTGIECQQKIDTVALGDHRKELAMYRVLQEALTNVEQHAAATKALVSLERKGEDLVLTVKDNGKGISKQAINSYHSLGLIGMRERLKPFKGELDITSRSNQGSQIRLTIPMAGH